MICDCDFSGSWKGPSMNSTICNQVFDTEVINNITITNSKVLIDTDEDFFELRYTYEEEIIAAKNYLKFKELTRKELLNAVNIIIMTCDYFINNKEQCVPCPLHKRNGCVFTCIPIEWRE